MDKASRGGDEDRADRWSKELHYRIRLERMHEWHRTHQSAEASFVNTGLALAGLVLAVAGNLIASALLASAPVLVKLAALTAVSFLAGSLAFGFASSIRRKRNLGNAVEVLAHQASQARVELGLPPYGHHPQDPAALDEATERMRERRLDYHEDPFVTWQYALFAATVIALLVIVAERAGLWQLVHWWGF